MDLIAAGLPDGVEILPLPGAPVLGRGHIPDRRIQPDVKVFILRAGYAEPEIRRVAGDIPVLDPLREPFLQLVFDLRTDVARGNPLPELFRERRELEIVVHGIPAHRFGPAHRADGIDQLHRVIGRGTGLAGIPVLLPRLARRAGALDHAVGKEHPAVLAVILLDLLFVDRPPLLGLRIDVLRQHPVLLAVRGIIIVEADIERREIPGVLLVHPAHQLLGSDPLLPGADHHRSAVGIVRAHVIAFVAAHALEPHPDVGLDVLHHMPQMDASVRIRKRTGHQDLTYRAHRAAFLSNSNPYHPSRSSTRTHRSCRLLNPRLKRA